MPTVTFNVLYVFFVLSLERRRVLYFNVTARPYGAWATQQIVEAIGAENMPVRLIRDRDAIFGTEFFATTGSAKNATAIAAIVVLKEPSSFATRFCDK